MVNTGGLTQLRLRFPLVDAGDDYVGFAGGDAGAWSPQTVSTFAEVAGSARPVLDLTYDPSTAVADGNRPGGPSTRGLFLAPPAPNPFNPSTVLVFSLERTEASAQLAVYDAAGRLVRVLHHGPLETGTHRRTWDGRDARGRQVASGIYLVRLSGGEGSVTRRAVLTK